MIARKVHSIVLYPHVPHLASFGFVKGDRSKRQAENFTQQKWKPRLSLRQTRYLINRPQTPPHEYIILLKYILFLMPKNWLSVTRRKHILVKWENFLTGWESANFRRKTPHVILSWTVDLDLHNWHTSITESDGELNWQLWWWPCWLAVGYDATPCNDRSKRLCLLHQSELHKEDVWQLKKTTQEHNLHRPVSNMPIWY